MDNQTIIAQPLQDDISLSEFSFEEMVNDVCCHPRNEEATIEEQPPTKKRKVSKKVRIVEQENELFYRPYDKEELKETWMSQSEFKAVKQGNRETLITILKSCGELSKVDAQEFCLRGLESHIEMFYTKRKRDGHKQAIKRVLADQELLRSMGLSDPEMISQVYGELSRHATVRAINLAFVDALR